MIKKFTYLHWIILVALPVLVSCTQESKRLSQLIITLWRQDKNPYGSYYAFENLKYIFPAADITINRGSPAESRSFFPPDYSGEGVNRKQRMGYIIISPQVIPDQREINALMNFVGEGNQVFISSFHVGDSLLRALKITMGRKMVFLQAKDSLTLSIYHPVSSDSAAFMYPGFAADNFIDSLDSQYTTVLGRDGSGRPDFVKFGYKGGGAIYLHFAPLAFSNFFLLHRNNKGYYDQALSYLPSNLEEIKWDDYFRNPRMGPFSAFQYILSKRPFRWAFWLVLILFGLIYLFESKRRQRLIPATVPKQNTSLDFVKTIGRLYYQQRDHANLASKMVTHFLDHVRTKYNLPTTVLDEEFIRRLSYKSGYSRQALEEIVTDIKMFQDGFSPEDDVMIEFNKKLEAFYKYE